MSSKRGNRGIGFDRDVIFYADLLAAVQLAGIRAIRQIVEVLNNSGQPGPYGYPWNYGVVYRLLKRGAALGVLLPPQSRREAALNRHRAVIDHPLLQSSLSRAIGRL